VFKGTTSDGETFQSRVRVSHVMAAPPSSITVSGAPAAANCDAVSLPAVQAGDPVVIEWARVTSSHPTIGRPGPVRIVRYQFFVEQGAFKLAMDLPPTVTRFEIPAEILAPGSAKFEIIARTSSGNNTAVESCFMVE
jgi:hypothetical protein